MFHSDGYSRVEKGESDENKIKRQDSSDRFLRDLKPINAPRDESFKSKSLADLMPRKVRSSQEYCDPMEEGQRRRLQWERTWDAAMRQQELEDANKEVRWEGRKVSTNLSKQRRAGRRSR
jgi:hypothetical protein